MIWKVGSKMWRKKERSPEDCRVGRVADETNQTKTNFVIVIPVL